MEETAKYFPQTAAALAALAETAAVLKENAALSGAEKEELKEKLSSMRQQLADKAACIDEIICRLNGAIK